MILIIIRHTVDCLRLNMDEIMKATDHLSKKNEIGKGGLGVYLWQQICVVVAQLLLLKY